MIMLADTYSSLVIVCNLSRLVLHSKVSWSSLHQNVGIT